MRILSGLIGLLCAALLAHGAAAAPKATQVSRDARTGDLMFVEYEWGPTPGSFCQKRIGAGFYDPYTNTLQGASAPFATGVARYPDGAFIGANGFQTWNETNDYTAFDSELRPIRTLKLRTAMKFGDYILAENLDGKWGVLSKTFETVLPFEFEASSLANALSITRAYAPLKRNGKWGVLASDLSVVAPFTHDQMLPTGEMFSIGSNGLFDAYSLKDGKLLSSVATEKGIDREAGYFYDIRSDGRRVLDADGKEIVRVSAYGRFYDGLAPFRVSETQWGYIDLSGAVVLPAVYKSIGLFENGLAGVTFADGSRGLIDKTGARIQFPAGHQLKARLDDGRFLTTSAGGKLSLVNANMTIAWTKTYEDVKHARLGWVSLLPAADNRLLVKQGGKWCVIDLAGNVLGSCSYWGLTGIGQGLLLGATTGGVVFLDLDGNVLTPARKDLFADGLQGSSNNSGEMCGYLGQQASGPIQSPPTTSTPKSKVYAADAFSGAQTDRVLYYVVGSKVYAAESFSGAQTSTVLRYIVGDKVYAADAMSGAQTTKVLRYIVGDRVYAADAFSGAMTSKVLHYVVGGKVYAADAITGARTETVLRYVQGNALTD